MVQIEQAGNHRGECAEISGDCPADAGSNEVSEYRRQGQSVTQVSFVPTGGVNLTNAAEFIEAGVAALGVGGECVQAEALKSNKPEIIVENARKFLAIVRQTRVQMKSASIAAKGNP
jgi:hypothetical protein